MASDFVHLRVHSSYSLDSVLKVPAICERVAGLGMRAVALTDHAVLAGVYAFRAAAENAGIQPIYGCELNVLDSPPVTLLAETEEGFGNLARIVSLPRAGDLPGELIIEKEDLSRHAAGLISLSPCAKREEFFLSETDWERAAEQALGDFVEIFGSNFYLEISDSGLPGQREQNERRVRLASRAGVPLVATQECRHLGEEDATALQALQCIKGKSTVRRLQYRNERTMRRHLRSPREMEFLFGRLAPESLRNTLAIAQRCRVALPARETSNPRFDCPCGMSSGDFLRRLALDGLGAILRDPSTGAWNIPPELEPDYTERLHDELSVVAECGAQTYFLILWDLARCARERKIPAGPGRGSVPGSLLAYALRLTDIDPVRHGLHFERFMNPLRNRCPDIDIDVCKERRGEIFEYLSGKYGAAHVAHTAVYGSPKGKKAIRVAGEFLGLPDSDVEDAAEAIWGGEHGSVRRTMAEDDVFRQVAEVDPGIGKMVSTAQALESAYFEAGRNLAQAAVTEDPIHETVPVYCMKDGLVTQFDAKSLAMAGVFTLDILGLSALTEMDRAARRIRGKTGTGIDLGNLPLDDRDTYEMLAAGDTSGVFQGESQGFRKMLLRVQPTCFSRLVDTITLFRPGPLRLGLDDLYIERLHSRPGDRGMIRLAVPEIDQILMETFGLILYQEQVMDLAVRLSGLSLREADLFRAAVCRKNEEEVDKYRPGFMEEGIRKGHPQPRMERIFGKNLEEGAVSFNKSHAISYGLLMYRSAYLKFHGSRQIGA